MSPCMLLAPPPPPAPPLPPRHRPTRHAGDDTLLLSSLGMGTYLGGEDDATDEAQLSALLYSISHGVNVVDTGTRAPPPGGSVARAACVAAAWLAQRAGRSAARVAPPRSA